MTVRSFALIASEISGSSGPELPMQVAAAESHQFVAETIEVVLQPGLFQVVGHHLGTGGQRGLHPWLGLEAFGDRITGDEAGGDHDRGIRCVRARGD